MNERSVFHARVQTGHMASAHHAMLRMIRAAQPISRGELSSRLGLDKSTVSEYVKPLLKSGFLNEETVEASDGKRKSQAISFGGGNAYFIGVNLGVRTTQVGVTDLSGTIEEIEDFTTPEDPATALRFVQDAIDAIFEARGDANCKFVGISVPGMPDIDRRRIVYAPNLKWRDIEVAGALKLGDRIGVVVENDSAAAALFEARLKRHDHHDDEAANFILVRSGTGIGVGLVIDGEVFRGTGAARGLAGEFGHMTIVAGGKQCVCGNRGCWEKYGSAASAASLYLGDRPLRPNESLPRFVEIVSKAENGEIRAQRSLEKIGDYLGVGIANVIMGVGIPRVVVSGRLVYGWKFIEKPLRDAIGRSIVGSIENWHVEAGEPVGAVIGGALEAAVDEYLKRGDFSLV